MAQQRRAQIAVDPADEQRELRAASPRRLIVSDAPLTLPQWLEVSWFYPEGFAKERIVETPRSWIVLGNGIAYKFLKLTGFAAQWEAACEEVIDNAILAPGLYLGLRVLRWSDDEPAWMSELRSPDLDPLRPPPDADGVAIIMRRIPEHRMLHHKLLARRSGTDSQLRSIAHALRRFHDNRQRAKPPESFTLTPRSLRRLYLAPLERFISEDASSLDTCTHYALREIAFWLTSFLHRNENLLRARRKLRTVIDCHGSLRCDRIATLEQEDDRVTTVVFGRLGRHDTARVNDLLSDVAALSSDLRARGFTAQADTFERRYWHQRLESYDAALYRFFLVAESARRAVLLLSGSVDDRFATATSYLALALRSALEIERPFLIVVSGQSATETAKIGDALDTLVGCVNVVPKGPRGAAHQAAIDDLELGALLGRCARRLAQRESAALLWPLHRASEREQIEACARELSVPLIFVHTEWGKAERLRYDTVARLGEGVLGRRVAEVSLELFAAPIDVPLVILEPSLHPADAALTVLHTLRRHLSPPP